MSKLVLPGARLFVPSNGHDIEKVEDHYENWGSIEQASTCLSDQIENHCIETGLRFDRIVLIPRGAYGPGNIVSRRLGFSAIDMLHMCIETRNKDHSQKDFVYGQMPLPEEVEGLIVLMLDEVGDSKKTGKHGKELLLLAGAAMVKTGVLHDKIDAADPDCRDFEWDWVGAPPVTGKPWIHYPWERHDKVGELSVVRNHVQVIGQQELMAA